MSNSIGLMESSKRLMGSLLSIFQTRLELLSNEVEEERLHIEEMLLYGSIALIFFSLSIMLLTVLVVLIFWDSYRLQVLTGFAALFFVAGLLAWKALCRLHMKKSKLFSASLSELANDREQLAPPP